MRLAKLWVVRDPGPTLALADICFEQEDAGALAAARADVKVEVGLVTDDEQAGALGFRGSPTVLVDGTDVEPESEGIPLGSMA